MKTFQAKVYVRSGNARIPHTVRIDAATVFSAQQLLVGMYGAENVISVPIEVKGAAALNPAPWMLHIGG